jgi:putative peptidoglycan lipid II flippase
MPIMLGVSVSQVNNIIDKSIASTVVEGGISALSYASIINNAVQEVLVTGIITILFANCATLVAKGEHELVKIKLSSTLQTFLTVLIPASCGVIILARPLVVCILGRGNFNENSVKMTVGALCCYTIGLSFLYGE